MNRQDLLERWDKFIEDRALPYYQSQHELYFRQVLTRYPFQRIRYLGDGDLVNTVNTGDNGGPVDRRPFSYFLVHLDRFLELHGHRRVG